MVVLPAPDGPIRPRIAPAGTASEIPSIASWSGNWTVTPSMTTASGAPEPPGAGVGPGRHLAGVSISTWISRGSGRGRRPCVERVPCGQLRSPAPCPSRYRSGIAVCNARATRTVVSAGLDGGAWLYGSTMAAVDASSLAESDGRASARAAGLRYSTDSRPGITRQRSGRGFSYRRPDGELIRDRAVAGAAAGAGDPARLDRRLDLPGCLRPSPGDRP